MSYIIRITKEEADAIRSTYPGVVVARTCRQRSKRHTYYAEEARGVLNLIRKMRGDMKKGR
jgi:hypothetical protein